MQLSIFKSGQINGSEEVFQKQFSQLRKADSRIQKY